MQLLKRLTPHTIAFLLFLAFYCIVIIDVRHKAWHDPSSFLFFDKDEAFERRYSLVRENEANKFIESASEAVNYIKSSPDPSLCVGIATKHRDGARYFRRTVGSIFEGLTEKERADIWLISFIVSRDPTEHEAYGESWLPKVSDQVMTYDNATEEVKAKLNEILAHGFDVKTKALYDYTYLLQACYDQGAPWIVILEDDVIAADGWYYRTKVALEELGRRWDFHKIVYLRLFYSERLLGWNTEEWPGYVGGSLVVEALVFGALVALAKYYPPAKAVLTARTILTVVGVCLPMLIFMYFAAGRITVAGPSPGIHPRDTYACCSQAFVFPREQVPALISFYQREAYGMVDLLTEKYADEQGLKRMMLSPSQFQHAGPKSTKPTHSSFWGKTNTETIFNFSFELFDPDELKELHIG